MSACISEPISWLRLERYRLLELAPEATREVERHLAACAACRACVAEVDAPRELAPLQLPVAARTGAQRRRPSAATRFAIGLGLAAAAAALLWLPPEMVTPQAPAPRMAVKGGELALNLVRLHGGSTGHDPSRFAPGDSFKVQLTCPPGLPGSARIVVLQAGAVYTPLDPYPLANCGNLRTVPGAFSLDGDAPATVCAAVEENTPLDLERLRRNGLTALPALSVCRTVER